MSESEAGAGRGGELSAEESARLSRHVAGVSASGLPLGPGLRALAEESPRGAFRAALVDLADALDRGVPPDQAVEGEAGRVPPHLRGLIRAGIRAGDLGDVLGRFADVARVGTDLRRTFWAGLIYPILAVGLTIVVFVLVDALIVDRFNRIFHDFGIPLPGMTMLLLTLSSIMRILAPFLLAAFAGLVLAWAFIGMLASRGARDSLVAWTPVIGTLWKYTAWAEFCHLLAMLLEARIPLPEALRLTGAAIENRDVERACRAMAKGVEDGAPLSAAMAGDMAGADPDGLRAIRRSMPEGLARLLRWAEGHAAIAEVLRMAGETFQARSRAEVAFGGAAAGFLAAAAVIVGLFVVVVGLFLPLVTLVTKLSG
ncbi:type II secretion system F family protein [Paludisphaera sp.]|uniref:type II secretion system F family protein n=1 Tax=Paludisphaera sp. TaxID=2017432 RepID=UPI00301DBA79